MRKKAVQVATIAGVEKKNELLGLWLGQNESTKRKILRL